MKSFFKNAVDEIVRRRIDQIEMEMTENPAQYPEFASALRELDGTDNSTAYAQELALECFRHRNLRHLTEKHRVCDFTCKCCSDSGFRRY